jgi:hypothetical protein
MKKVIIQIATEFHYMVALSLIDKYYTGKDFDVSFVIVVNSFTKSRLESIKLDTNYTYFFCSYNHHEKIVFPDVIKLKQFIESNKFYHFVSFLYHDPLFVYLTYFFKNKNTTTFLAPDGMGAYVKFTASNYRSRLVNTLKSYSFLKLHGFKFPKFWFTSWDFGKNGYYDCIYAYSKTLPFLPNKKIIEVDYSFSEEKIESLKKTFSISFDNYPELTKVVLIINDRHNLPEYESLLLKTIANKLPDYKILFKKHPNQNPDNLKYISDNVFRIDEIFPVELLIASLKDGIIISSYSNSMLYHNPSCSYFWTYPIVVKSGELKKNIDRFNPKSYITVVQNIKEIENHLSKIANV